MSLTSLLSLDFDLPTTVSDIASEFDTQFNLEGNQEIEFNSEDGQNAVIDSLRNFSNDFLPTVENTPTLEDLAHFTTDLFKPHLLPAYLPQIASPISQMGAQPSVVGPIGVSIMRDLPENALAFATIDSKGKPIDNGQGDVSQQRKWTRSDGKSDGRGATVITFAFDDSFSVKGISTERAKTLLAAALQAWANYSPLDFVEITDPGSSDLVDIFAQSQAIDGPSKTLAYAFFPSAGDITFDTDETWSENKFLETAVHELGHSLGLDHEDDTPAIMNSVLSNRYTDEAFLLEDDIKGIRSLYGTGKGSVTRLKSELSATPATPTSPVSAPVAAANLAINGSFETVPLAVGESGIYSSIQGWSTLSGNGFQVDRRPALVGQAAEGTAWVELDAYGANNTIGQNIDTLTGEIYNLSVDFSNGGRAESTTSVEVFWEGKKIDTLSGGGKGLWRKFDYQLKGGDRNVSTLAFRAIGPSDNVGGYIDNIVITAAREALNQGLDITPTLNRDPISGEPQNLMAAALTASGVPTALI